LKKILTIILILVVGIGVLVGTRQNSKECGELVFQKSPLFGTSPRRYLEVSELPSSSFNFLKRSYVISLQCMPLLVITTSSFTCAAEDSLQPSESQFKELAKSIKGCEKYAQ
jgi:type IV secretory pathway VirB2 component (pilin)